MSVSISEIPKGKLVIRNIGRLLSGDLAKPILEADTVVAVDGLITAVGGASDCDTGRADRVVDAKGTTLSPGLIDSHVHPVFGDWTPRQSQLGWIDSFLNGGVTTMISAGEVHLPGRPKDIVGLKAHAITAQRSFDAFRPGGVKVLAGAPVIEKGMVESDFAELAKSGAARSRPATKRSRWWPGHANTASSRPSIPAARRCRARATSTRTWCS